MMMGMWKYCLLTVSFLMVSCGTTPPSSDQNKPPIDELFAQFEGRQDLSQATFSGGCFWCTEAFFQEEAGVEEVISGFVGEGEERREAVRIYFDSQQVSYEHLLDIYWDSIDPTDEGGQFFDRGQKYTTALFYHDSAQQVLAEASKQAFIAREKLEKPVVTKILPLASFHPAEEFHQDFYLHSKDRYQRYKEGSGRNRYFKERASASPYALTEESIETLRSGLDKLSYKVIVKDGTEKPFENDYWDLKDEGIYVDKISGEPLFSSTHKYVSGTGWPSFYRPLTDEHITLHEDRKLFAVRTEVRSRYGDSHLGHVFDDGPEEHGGKRYCMNSAALRFVPKAGMEKEGYSDWMFLFEE